MRSYCKTITKRDLEDHILESSKDVYSIVEDNGKWRVSGPRVFAVPYDTLEEAERYVHILRVGYIAGSLATLYTGIP